MDIFKVIKCDGKDCGNDVFVWKFPGEDFNTLSQLIVHESQEPFERHSAVVPL